MASKNPTTMNEPPIAPIYRLKKWEPDPFPFNDQPSYKEPTTPSEWFSFHFPEQAKIYGCPFLESFEPLGDGINHITPIAPNIDFMAAILGGDRKLGHHIVYIETEMAFYYYDNRDQMYKATSSEKLGNQMRAYLIRCAEELGANVDKCNLFLDFRSEKTIRSIIHRAKSILAADGSYFSVESKHQRQQGPELYERVARAFVEQALERIPGETLLLTDAYLYFCEYLRKKNMPPVNRRVFKDLIPAVIKEEYDLGVRNDLMNETGDKWQRGWKGIGILEPEAAVQVN